jgi:flavin-dependent thymidylate synthase
MKVSLIDYTGYGNPDQDHAINVLIFTKSTRLTMSPGLLSEIAAWPWEKKLEELKYMANTIPSSWEFVDYTFMVEGVTRAFTHQFVRSRQFSFAQQTMRVLDVSTGPGWDYLTGPSVNSLGRHDLYDGTMETISKSYKSLIADGTAVEDARGILPTNILTNIVGKCNMRTFVELVRKRSSPRTQNEYRDVLDAMKAAVREVHPWIDLFIERDMDKAIADLQQYIEREPDTAQRIHATKLLDQIRAQS